MAATLKKSPETGETRYYTHQRKKRCQFKSEKYVFFLLLWSKAKKRFKAIVEYEITSISFLLVPSGAVWFIDSSSHGCLHTKQIMTVG